MTRHQFRTSPELNSKSDLIIREGTVEKRAGFTLYALGVYSIGIDTSAFGFAPVKVSGGQSDQDKSPLELAKIGHKIQEEVADCLVGSRGFRHCLMLKLPWVV